MCSFASEWIHRERKERKKKKNKTKGSDLSKLTFGDRNVSRPPVKQPFQSERCRSNVGNGMKWPQVKGLWRITSTNTVYVSVRMEPPKNADEIRDGV